MYILSQGTPQLRHLVLKKPVYWLSIKHSIQNSKARIIWLDTRNLTFPNTELHYKKHLYSQILHH